MPKQKYPKGTLVQIDKDLGSSMSHFPSEIQAVVIGTYSQLCGGDDVDSYAICHARSTYTSWYHEHQLTKIGGQGAGRQQVENWIPYWEKAGLDTRSIRHTFE